MFQLSPTATCRASTRRDSAEPTRLLVLDPRMEGYFEIMEFAAKEYLREALGDAVDQAPSGTAINSRLESFAKLAMKRGKQIDTRVAYRQSRKSFKGARQQKEAEQLFRAL